MQKKKKEYKFYKLLFIYILVLSFVLIMNFINISNNSFYQCIKDFSIKTYYELTKPIKIGIEYINSLTNIKHIINENERLKIEVSYLSPLKITNEKLNKEVENLKKTLNIKTKYKDYELITAEVILRNNDYWYDTLTINKGKKVGIQVNDTVLNEDGLVGRVISVSKNTGVVALITGIKENNKTSIKIKGEDKEYNTVINSYEDGFLVATGITNYDKVSIGNKVYTSGLGNFLNDIEVGTIKNIENDRYETGKIIKIKPSVDFSNLKYVSIIRSK